MTQKQNSDSKAKRRLKGNVMKMKSKKGDLPSAILIHVEKNERLKVFLKPRASPINRAS